MTEAYRQNMINTFLSRRKKKKRKDRTALK